MNLMVWGISFQSTPIGLRERLALDGPKQIAAATELAARFECESAILNTCNRVEIYLATADNKTLPDAAEITEFLCGFHNIPADVILPQLVCKAQTDGVRHLFRVASSLDSLIVGEAQIAGQVKARKEAQSQLAFFGLGPNDVEGVEQLLDREQALLIPTTSDQFHHDEAGNLWKDHRSGHPLNCGRISPLQVDENIGIDEHHSPRIWTCSRNRRASAWLSTMSVREPNTPFASQ